MKIVDTSIVFYIKVHIYNKKTKTMEQEFNLQILRQTVSYKCKDCDIRSLVITFMFVFILVVAIVVLLLTNLINLIISSALNHLK